MTCKKNEVYAEILLNGYFKSVKTAHGFEVYSTDKPVRKGSVMKKSLLVMGMVVVSGILYSCGGSGSSSSGIKTTVAAPAISTTKTVVSTPAEAAKTVNASKSLASSFATGSSFPSLSSLVGKPTAGQAADAHRIISTVRDLQQRVLALQKMPKKMGKSVAAIITPAPQACVESGSQTVSYNDATGDVSMTANNCKENYELTNGTMSFTGISQGATSGTGGRIVMNMTTISYASGGYTTKESESVINMTMTIESFDSSVGSQKFKINGSQSSINYLSGTSGTSEKQVFGNFTIDMTEGTSGSDTTISMTMDGSVSMDTFTGTTFTDIDEASGMSFQDLRLVNVFNTNGTNSLTINGIYAIKTIPACMDGTFEISTASPIVSDGNGTTSGQMTVNGVVMVFNPDGTITATIDGQPQALDLATYAPVCSMSF